MTRRSQAGPRAVEERNQPGFYGGAFTGPFFVLTRDVRRKPPVVQGVTGRVLHGPIEAAVRTAQRAAAGRDVVVLGGTVARACIEADLLDEIIVFVAPVLLGDGKRLYEGLIRRLELVDTAREGEITTLTLTPRPSQPKTPEADPHPRGAPRVPRPPHAWFFRTRRVGVGLTDVRWCPDRGLLSDPAGPMHVGGSDPERRRGCGRVSLSDRSAIRSEGGRPSLG